jgi:epoxyqueuosine reductase
MADAKSVIVLGASYAPADDPLALLDRPERGAVSVYARPARDYHDTLKKRARAVARALEAHFPDNELKLFVDTAPVMEKPLAARAGLGWQGKHSNLVSREFGSWLFLAEIFTTLDIPADAPATDRCGSCDACLRACPTDAFPAPGQLDARRCVSYLTIEHTGMIAPDLMAAMGNRIYGCDDCLAVCPWNKFAAPTTDAAFQPRADLAAPELAELAALDDDGFKRMFAGSPIKRTGRARFLRNVLIAIANSGDAALLRVAEGLQGDAAPLVAETAGWAAAQLASALDDRGRGDNHSHASVTHDEKGTPP